MINIKSGKQLLLLRFNNYKSNSFIQEHRTCIDEYGSVWVLKIGRKIPENRLKDIVESGGVLLLKEPKADGGKYYVAHISEYYYGSALYNMTFPDYYYEMEDDENIWNMEDGLLGTWLHIDHISDLPKKYIPAFRLISNGKPVEEILTHTMSSMMYIQSDKSFSVK